MLVSATRQYATLREFLQHAVNSSEIMSTEQAARFLDVSQHRVMTWCKLGLLGIKMGGSRMSAEYLVTHEELMHFDVHKVTQECRRRNRT